MRLEAEGGARSIPPFLSPYQDLAEQLCHACKRHYGTRLVSVALFGSVARGTPQFDSDLDVLIVADDLAQGRMKRAREFERIEAALAPTLDSMRLSGIAVELSPVFKTPAEIEQGSPLLLDMTEDAHILYDRAGFWRRRWRACRPVWDAWAPGGSGWEAPGTGISSPIFVRAR